MRDVSCVFQMRIACCCGGRKRADGRKRCANGSALLTRWDGEVASRGGKEGQRVVLYDAKVSNWTARGGGGGKDAAIEMSLRSGKMCRDLRPCEKATERAGYVPRSMMQISPPNCSDPDMGDVDVSVVVVHATPPSGGDGARLCATLFCMNERCATFAIKLEFDALETDPSRWQKQKQKKCASSSSSAASGVAEESFEDVPLPHPLRSMSAPGSILALRDVMVQSADTGLGVYNCVWTRRSSATLLCAPEGASVAAAAASAATPGGCGLVVSTPANTKNAGSRVAQSASVAAPRARAPPLSGRHQRSGLKLSRRKHTPLTRMSGGGSGARGASSPPPSRGGGHSAAASNAALAAPLLQWLQCSEGRNAFAVEKKRVHAILCGDDAATSPNPGRAQQQSTRDGEVSTLLTGLTFDDFGSQDMIIESATSPTLFADLALGAFDNPSQDVANASLVAVVEE
tara:strand:- start:282 stop:1655 length:1374 start_codon:yes stop_codon:yes gene_type:complete